MSRLNAVAKTALAYAERGVPVIPAFPLVRSASGLQGRMPRRRWACGCSDRACPVPGTHPLPDAHPLDRRDEVLATWDVPHTPGLMVAPNESLDLWDVGCELGAAAMRILERQRLSVWPPTMRLPSGRWAFVTTRLQDAHMYAEAASFEVLRHDRKSPLLVPPSRATNGRLRWLWSPKFPNAPLPDANVMLGALVMAAGHVVPRGAADDAHREFFAGPPPSTA